MSGPPPNVLGAGINGHSSRCRCSPECVEQTRKRINEQRNARAQRLGLVIRHGRMVPPSNQPSGVAHGTRSSYTYGCRCEPCRAANSDYHAARRPARPPLVAVPDWEEPTEAPTTTRLFVRADWMDDGECRHHDPDLFFPGHGEPTAPAKAICAVCPVRVRCLTHALEQGEKFGIWGGTSERQRKRMRAQRRLAVVA